MHGRGFRSSACPEVSHFPDDKVLKSHTAIQPWSKKISQQKKNIPTKSVCYSSSPILLLLSRETSLVCCFPTCSLTNELFHPILRKKQPFCFASKAPPICCHTHAQYSSHARALTGQISNDWREAERNGFNRHTYKTGMMALFGKWSLFLHPPIRVAKEEERNREKEREREREREICHCGCETFPKPNRTTVPQNPRTRRLGRDELPQKGGNETRARRARRDRTIPGKDNNLFD